jgi:predicted O-linked N-acetylglucosamine transferase (SPINDLY family)
MFCRDQASLAVRAQEYDRRTTAELYNRVKSGERDPAAYLRLAKHHVRLQRLEVAIAVLQEGLAGCEPDQELYGEAIFALEEANRTEEARLLARRAKEIFPHATYLGLSEALMLPVLYETEQEVDEYRARFAAGLDALVAGLRLETPEECRRALAAVSGHLQFYLGYQGRDDRELQKKYGQFVHRIMAANYPQWVKPLAMPRVSPSGRIRVGYITAHFRDHSVSKLFLGWLAEHNRHDFELFAYHNGRRVDAVTEEVRRVSDHFRHLPGELEGLCRAVLSDDLHIAVFLDVRHRRMAMISALRLAPVQCVAWSHPITSGSPMIDYYLSGDLMEPAKGQDHYCERLIRLPGIGTCYPKPVIPRALLGKRRGDFGLSEDRIVFLCCQSSFKYLPQNDDLFARIAKRLPVSQFVFLALNDVIAGVFRARLQRAFVAEELEAADHCVILPQLRPFDYWNLNLLSDVFLDSLEWSGGVTTLEAIACGLPVVTLPGRFMRGRHSYGILTQLGVTDTIARDKASYVDLAVRLGSYPAWRAEILERMKAAQARLYSETGCVRGLEVFFRSVANQPLSQDRTIRFW